MDSPLKIDLWNPDVSEILNNLQRYLEINATIDKTLELKLLKNKSRLSLFDKLESMSMTVNPSPEKSKEFAITANLVLDELIRLNSIVRRYEKEQVTESYGDLDKE